VDFVVERLGLEPGARILERRGRHSLELARRRLHVKGVDLSPRSLELAQEATREESLDVAFVERDARELDFDANAVAHALVPDGSFLVDTVNAFALGRR
jgi:ubiquinone/menaquinone biosynthesis C-methylase UbiE